MIAAIYARRNVSRSRPFSGLYQRRSALSRQRNAVFFVGAVLVEP